MKRILHLIDTSGPGGAETVFLNLVSAFDVGGFRSFALVAEGSWVGGALEARGHHAETCNARGSFNVAYLRAISRLVRRHDIDLIQAHLPGPAIYAGLYAMLSRVPLVSVLHGSVDFGNVGRYPRVKIGALNRGSSRIVAVSEHLSAELQRTQGLDPAKLCVIHNGVDLATFSGHGPAPLRRQLGLAEDAFLVCSIGNIRPAKGYDVLVRAAARLEGAPRQIHFVVAGDPRRELHEQLVALREELGVASRVHFLGFRDDAAGILAASDLFLLPSTSEGFSISTIEAMAAGLPVVATRSGGPQEILEDGVDGFLVPPADPAAIADAVHRLAADQTLRDALARRARETVRRRFSLEAMVDAYRRLYRTLLD